MACEPLYVLLVAHPLVLVAHRKVLIGCLFHLFIYIVNSVKILRT